MSQTKQRLENLIFVSLVGMFSQVNNGWIIPGIWEGDSWLY